MVDYHPGTSNPVTPTNGTKSVDSKQGSSKVPSEESDVDDKDSVASDSKTVRKYKTYSLSPDEERQLVNYILCLSRCGKSVNITDIKNIAMSLNACRDKGFAKNEKMPTNGWVARFKSRHPDLDYKNHDYSLNKTHIPLTRSELKSWEWDLKNFLRSDWKIDVDSFFKPENGNRIYTCDEIVIAFTKLDNKEKVPKSEDKELVTVISSASATGEYLKPFLLLPGDNCKTTKLFPTLDPSSYQFQLSSTGLVNDSIFHEWLRYFDKYLTLNQVERPVVLLLDDHQSHFQINVFLDCLDKQIVPICLPGKLNKLLQPLLANFFPKLMVAYQACCKRYTQKTGKGITYDSFPYVMMKAWTLVSKAKFITDGFNQCKLIPFNICAHECVETADSELVDTKSKLSKEDIGNSDSSRLSVAVKRELSEDPVPTLSAPQQTTTKKVTKRRKVSSNSSSISSIDKVPTILGDKHVPDERKLGRQEGIDMCLSVLESFVPPDILPVWQARSSNHKGTSEVEYCMWQAVKMLASGGLEVVSQMQKQQLQFANPKWV